MLTNRDIRVLNLSLNARPVPQPGHTRRLRILLDNQHIPAAKSLLDDMLAESFGAYVVSDEESVKVSSDPTSFEVEVREMLNDLHYVGKVEFTELSLSELLELGAEVV